MIRSCFIIILIAFTACSQKPGTAESDAQNQPGTAVEEMSKENTQAPMADSSITFKTIPAEGGAAGFGYDIYMNGKLYVHQPTIPAVAGNRAFSTEQKAAQAAQLVVYKIQHHILPPTVEVRELDSLHLLD